MKLKEILREEIFAPDRFFNNCHASTVLKHGNRLLCAWFAGTKEGNDDVEIYLSVNDGEGWSEPKRMTVTDVPCWNPVLFEHDGEITLFYKTGRKIPQWRTYCMSSADGGETWSQPQELVVGDVSGGRGPVKNKPILLSDGRIAAPASVETEKTWDAFVDISTDSGRTWEKSSFMPFDHSSANGTGVIQPTLWQTDDGIHALLRSSEGCIMHSFSSDGSNWTVCEKTELPNNNSGIDCVKIGDSVVVVFNPIAESWGDRNIISYTLCDENARNFGETVLIEAGVDTEAEFSYPAVITDGKYVYITYTHNRKSIEFVKLEIISD